MKEREDQVMKVSEKKSYQILQNVIRLHRLHIRERDIFW